MSDASALAHNLKQRLLERYPDTWIIEAASSDDEQHVRVGVRDPVTGRCHRHDYQVKGFHIELVFEAIRQALPPPTPK